jgi:fucose permease
LVGSGYFGFILIGWNSVLVPSLIRSIEHDFRQTDAALGLFYLLVAIVYAACSFGSGFLTERIGRRAVLPGSAALIAIGLLGDALAPSWPLFILAALPVGVGVAGIDAGTNGLFLDLFREARGGAMSLLHVFYSVGALISPFVVGRLITAGVDWRLILFATAIAAALFAVALRRRDMPSGLRDRRSIQEPEAIALTETSLLPFACLALAICFLVMGEQGVSSWLVRFLSRQSVATATTVLSLFWGGLAAGRAASRWAAERIDYTVFTAGCMLLASACLLAAVLVSAFPLSASLFALTGLFYGPVYPMIMAIGGNIYPHRLAALAGSLGASAVVGAVAYPPLMGLIGLRTGMIGASLIGLLSVASIVGASVAAKSLQGESYQGFTPTSN